MRFYKYYNLNSKDFAVYSLGKSPIDGSLQYKLVHREGGELIFGVSSKNDELYAHTWLCPGYGKLFLAKIEEIAHNWKISRIIVPNVVNPKLITILEKHGYEKAIMKSPIFGPVEVYIKYLK